MTTTRPQASSTSSANETARREPGRAGCILTRGCCWCHLWQRHGAAMLNRHHLPCLVSLSRLLFPFLSWVNLELGSSVSVQGS